MYDVFITILGIATLCMVMWMVVKDKQSRNLNLYLLNSNPEALRLLHLDILNAHMLGYSTVHIANMYGVPTSYIHDVIKSERLN